MTKEKNQTLVLITVRGIITGEESMSAEFEGLPFTKTSNSLRAWNFPTGMCACAM